ncbi:MAG: hypothetical protein ACFFCW_21260 [Candidatus Hodarchaeota archaeon]
MDGYEIQMFEVYPNLFIGTENDCFFQQEDCWAVVHACKSPCHQRALGYKGSLPNTHPYYLVFEHGNHLFLNMIDPSQPLFMPPLFVASLNFVEKHISERKVLIHCNLGLSRAPSLALLYLAKRAKAVNNENYGSAAQDFTKLFPNYSPSRGIVIYLSTHWNDLQ